MLIVGGALLLVAGMWLLARGALRRRPRGAHYLVHQHGRHRLDGPTGWRRGSRSRVPSAPAGPHRLVAQDAALSRR